MSVYATAKDGHAEARTEMAFVQAEPFEREFSQSQQSGGGGGGGGQQGSQTDISKREKELIAATWKQVNATSSKEKSKATAAKEAEDAGKFLSDVQTKLREQVLALSGRMQSRDLATATEEFTAFEKDMQAAASAMAPSAAKLKGMEWKDAIPMEEKALQYMLRAEATFRQIQVAFGQQKGGGAGGGGGSAGRDLASLFDLELDTEKNQYETAQSASPAEQKAKEVDDALAKLDALAKRQEELAQKQQQSTAQSFEQRWQQEMLRREAERLEKQMQQMAEAGQKGQQGQQSSGQSGGQSSGQASGSQSGGQASGRSGAQGGQQGKSGSQNAQGGQSGQAGQSDPRVTQALNRLRQADEEMKRSAAAKSQSSQAGGQQQSVEAARRAAESLRQATNLLGGAQQQQASGKVDSLAREADRLSKEEEAQAGRIQGLTKGSGGGQSGTGQGGSSGDLTPEQVGQRITERNRLAEERQRLSDDLAQLERGVRDAARSLAPNQPDTAAKLRDALNGMDQTDLGNRVQRTADWLRRGVDPNSNGTEAGIAKDLQKLDEQVRQAQQGMGTGQPGIGKGQGTGQGRDAGQQTAALDHVDRLRSQIESLSGSSGRGKNGGGSAGQQGGKSRQGQETGQGQQGQGQQGQSQGQGEQGQQGRGQGQGQGGQPQGSGQGGQGAQRGGVGGGGRQGGPVGVRQGGFGEGAVQNNVDTGGQQFDQSGKRVIDGPQNRGGAEAGQQAYRNGLTELNQLRQLAKDDPAALKEIQDLVKEMQKLDPNRFVGNPAMVEQLHAEVLSSVDKLELQLRRGAQDTAGQVRTSRPAAVQQGYQDAVADYYRRLSKSK